MPGTKCEPGELTIKSLFFSFRFLSFLRLSNSIREEDLAYGFLERVDKEDNIGTKTPLQKALLI